MSGEFSRIAKLQRIYKWTKGDAQPASSVSSLASLLIGIGDDAAVLRTGATDLVWTVDAQVEGRHFRRAWLSLEDVGWRAYMAAASDLAAMGADPWCALSSLIVPADLLDDDVEALGRGGQAAAEAVGAPIVGGNLSGGGELSLTTTLLGRVAHSNANGALTTLTTLTRSGAKAGDAVWLAGPVGLAAAGFRALSTNAQMIEPTDAALVAWRRPVARIAEGREARSAGATAAIDVSDGLAPDVAHLAEASGVGVTLDEAAILAAGGDALGVAASLVGAEPIALALYGGEDYALVVTAPEGTSLAGFTRIGDVTAEAGLFLRNSAGFTRPIAAGGFDHFAD